MRTQSTDREDRAACRQILAHGSKSFTAASWLLPRRIRGDVAAIYAFCRVADDEVDEGHDVRGAVARLRRRLDDIFAGTPADDPVDRAFANVVARYGIPRVVPGALIEGFAWDAEGRRYESLADLEGYCARVASTVGVMMTYLMGPVRRGVLARACDLGLAMQLTNIARDIGEDARAGRVYLPEDWLRQVGLSGESLVAEPRPSAALATVTRRLLAVARRHYRRADAGIAALAPDSRIAIRAARLIYADIGRVIAQRGYDSVSGRAHTGTARKLWLALRSIWARFWPTRALRGPARRSVRFLLPKEATD